jgi:hypothetical protein
VSGWVGWTALDGIDLVVRVDGADGGLESWAQIAAELTPEFQPRLVARRG